MTSALTLASRRRLKWLVLAVWIGVVAVAGPLAGKLEEVQENDQASFLPEDAESVRALELAERFPSGEITPAIVVYRRPGGLTEADRERIARDRRSIARDRPLAGGAAGPPGNDGDGEGPRVLPPGEVRVSPDGTTALFTVPIVAGGDSDPLVEATAEIRERVGEGAGGLDAEVTGPAGFATDAIDVFESIDGTLLIAAASLVFVLLVLIYRSPVFWAIPFFSVVIAEVTSRAMGYGLAEAGVTVNGQSAAMLTVLVFGAGTDYALLLVARYREELRRHEDRHDAMARALRRAGPAIVASGLTVIAALLCLSIAEVNSTAAVGPIGALGIALAMVAMLTLLPALLLVAGRRAFWPFIPRHGSEGADETHGPWRRLGERIARRPRPVWLAATGLLVVLAAGTGWLNTDLTTGNSFRGSVDSVQGQRLVEAGFPGGATAPTSVIVTDPSEVEEVRRALASTDGVAELGPVERGGPGARFTLTLRADPYGDRAFDLIPRLRDVAEEAAGDSVVIGGPTAEEFDFRESAARDNLVIIPLALVVVLAVLIALLRSLAAPVLLIATVVASFAAALGAGAFTFEVLLDFPGIDPALPLFAFVFLVALGIDYNIFLMARVREEALRHGTRQGMLRGLAVTGGVITSAGIVLAGTFLTLAVLPLYALTEIGGVIAFGVLLDTFLVRSVLVPALVLDAGPPVWWPSRLARRRDEPRPEAVAAGTAAERA